MSLYSSISTVWLVCARARCTFALSFVRIFQGENEQWWHTFSNGLPRSCRPRERDRRIVRSSRDVSPGNTQIFPLFFAGFEFDRPCRSFSPTNIFANVLGPFERIQFLFGDVCILSVDIIFEVKGVKYYDSWGLWGDLVLVDWEFGTGVVEILVSRLILLHAHTVEWYPALWTQMHY